MRSSYIQFKVLEPLRLHVAARAHTHVTSTRHVQLPSASSSVDISPALTRPMKLSNIMQPLYVSLVALTLVLGLIDGTGEYYGCT
jgi:hypothetical protein